MLNVEIDPGSGFCGGVIRAITCAEQTLSDIGKLYSLGDSVHNEEELARLKKQGLVTINQLSQVPEGETVLIRAHGEPPSTYEEAARRRLSVIDCSCPVVLLLQRNIREAYARLHSDGRHGQVLIFGRVGHAEVLGLLGQVDGDALVIEDVAMLESALAKGTVDLSQPIEIFSQTTKSPQEYSDICDILTARGAHLTVHDTVCAQVASRHQKLTAFAAAHDVILFVSGKQSSNGKVLSNLCRRANVHTYMIGGAGELDASWFRDGQSVGVCGATSTPKWLLEEVAEAVRNLII